jgi:hypothetical protein
MKSATRALVAIALALSALNASATTSLYLLSQQTSVRPGDVVEIAVWLDFTDSFVLGGGFDVTWDSRALQFEAIETLVVGDPQFGRDPDVFDGLLESWAVADFSGITGVHQLGTIWFTVMLGMGPSTIVAPTDTNGIGGPWTDGFWEVQVDYQGTLLTQVPVPAAFWLLLGALGVTRWRATRAQELDRRVGSRHAHRDFVIPHLARQRQTAELGIAQAR